MAREFEILIHPLFSSPTSSSFLVSLSPPPPQSLRVWSLRHFVSEVTFINGPSLTGLALVDYNVPKMFMNTVRVRERSLNLTYVHSRGDYRIIMDGTFVYDSANKVSTNYTLNSGNYKLKYTYVHKGLTTFAYDMAKNMWDFFILWKVYSGNDTLRASYQTYNRVLGVEWLRNPKHTAGFKVE
ncbi:hypothetical protein JHK85_051425 [Glycine max]|nr:hypothetical protein JHK85_051425 [Glycine max]